MVSPPFIKFFPMLSADAGGRWWPDCLLQTDSMFLNIHIGILDDLHVRNVMNAWSRVQLNTMKLVYPKMVDQVHCGIG